jgi:hypothetical protein
MNHNSHTVTSAGEIRSRFDLFVVLQRTETSYYPNRKRAWCHRGDKFCPEPERQLQALLRMINRYRSKWQLFELYDNTKPKNEPGRIVLKMYDGVIEANRLHTYAPLLQKFILPKFLQQ